MNRIYFASPFFNDEQIEREERLKRKLRDLGFKVWSPKENCNCPPDASVETRINAFSSNLKEINKCDILFAVTDGKDVGTIWEAGYAYGTFSKRLSDFRTPIKIVYYCETLGEGDLFNLMLAHSGDVVFTSFDQLDLLPSIIERGSNLSYDGLIE